MSDRRAKPRIGRRATDPRQTCPSCGLPFLLREAHANETACIAALRLELERLGRLTKRK
jgi:hypothetical protein